MDCGACAAKIETALRRMPGIDEVEVSLSSGAVTVRHDGRAAASELQRVVTRLGFTALDDAVNVGTLAGPGPRVGSLSWRGDSRSASRPGRCAPGAGGGCCATSACAEGAAAAPLPSASQPRSRDAACAWWATRAGVTMLLTGAAIVLAYGVGLLAPQLERLALVAAVALGLVPIGRRALVNARYGTPFSIEMLMTIAAVAAVAIGAEAEAAAVLLLFLIGELLERAAANRARAGIHSLTALMPKTARRESGDGRSEEILAERLAIGDTIQVRPGDRIPADGIVLSGRGGVDESPLTGESVPRPKGPDDSVHAGTINCESLLRVRVTADASDNTIARIVRMVEEAQEKKAPTARFIERFARYYTPLVVLVATLVAIAPPLFAGAAWVDWIYRGAALLLIGCPCALVISTPAAIAAGLTAGAREGLLIKGGAVLEELGRITLVAFDKTGTLTLGRPRVTDVLAVGAADRAAVLADAAALSAGSSHPVARAILAEASASGVAPSRVDDLVALPGKGVAALHAGGRSLFLGSLAAAAERAVPWSLAAAEPLVAEGKTISVLVRDREPLGLIALRDEIRPDAQAGIAGLRRLGIEALMLTGDSRAVAERVGEHVGIPAHAELLPEDKLQLVKAHQARGRRVAKVGDGINDAPALAAADVGVAMGGGTEVALETADAASLHGRVADVAAMVALSRRTLGVVRQNLALALGLKLVLLFTTIGGATGLWAAVLADTGATVLVTANALRLLGGLR